MREISRYGDSMFITINDILELMSGYQYIEIVSNDSLVYEGVAEDVDRYTGERLITDIGADAVLMVRIS